MENWNYTYQFPQQDDFLDIKTSPMPVHASHEPTAHENNALAVAQPVQQPSAEVETMNHLKLSVTKLLTIVERLEQRMNKVEQTTSQILKNQQEVLQVPFISQSELDNARKHAEQLEQDTAVAKQLQAAYNKEVEVRKNSAQQAQIQMKPCPICGTKVPQTEIERHVDQCIEQISTDMRKEVTVQDVKKESGFFSRLVKTTEKTKEKTKVHVVPANSATAPLLTDHEGMTVNPNNYYPTPVFGYHGFPPMHPHGHGSPQMVPMYPMFPGYPMANSSINSD